MANTGSFPVVSGIVNAFTVVSVKGQQQQMHCRPYYGLSLCESGRIVYTHRQKQTVSVPACAILLPVGESYRIDRVESGTFPIVNFTAAEPTVNEFLSFPVADFSAAMAVFNELRSAVDAGDSLLAISHLYRLFSMLRYPPRSTPIDAVLAYIREHYGDITLNNTRLAAQAHISEVYLRRLFKTHLGVTPHRYLSDLRLRESRRLLAETTLSVGAIADRCGFASVYHFSRLFRQAMGLSPSAYRHERKTAVL